MKGGVLLGLLLAGSPLMAQGIIKPLGDVAKNALQAGRVLQGKIMLNVRPTTPPVLLERYIFTPLNYDFSRISLKFPEPTAQQLELFKTRYNEIMTPFLSKKRELDPILYYQANTNERHVLSSMERSHWVEQILEMDRLLNDLSTLVWSGEKVLLKSREYVHFAMKTVSPESMGLLALKPSLRLDRVLDESEFFMYNPPEELVPASAQAKEGFFSWGASLFRRRPQPPLPSGIKMAVLNDRETVLDAMQKAHQKGNFCADWELSFYTDAQQLVDDITLGGKKVDLVLTDLVVPGGGGYFVTYSLRQAGMPVTIVAGSAFEEDIKMARSLFDYGFDGMIPLKFGFEFGSGWETNIMRKLSNYFYYKNKNGWIR